MSRYSCKCCGEGDASMKMRYIVAKIEERLPSECEIEIHSCFRCEENNISSDGEDDSQHLDGDALDFHVSNLHYLDLYYLLLDIEEIHGIGIYIHSDSDKYFVHIDTERRTGRRWCYLDGEQVDFPFERML